MKKIRKMMAILIVAVLTLMMVPATVFAETVEKEFEYIYVYYNAPDGFESYVGGSINDRTFGPKNVIGTGEAVYGHLLSYWDISFNDEPTEEEFASAITVNPVEGYSASVDVTEFDVSGSRGKARILITFTANEPEATKGSITINNAVNGETYTLYKVMDVDINSSGGINYHSETIPEELQEYFEITTGSNAGSTYEYVALKDGETVLDEDDTIPQDIIDAFSAWAENAEETTHVAASNGQAVFTNVDPGYYVIKSSLGNTIMIDSATNPAAEVYEKNEANPVYNLTKTVDEGNENVKIGDEVEYTISFNTSNYSGAGEGAKQIIYYVLKDELPESLTATDYTIKVNGAAPTVAATGDLFGEDGAKLTWATLDAGSNPETYTSLYNNNSTITVTYTATVNAQASGAITNTVTIDYLDKDEESIPDTPKQTTKTIYTYEINIEKTDGEGNPLDGAQFKLYDAATGGNQIYVTGSNGTYVVSTEPTEVLIEAGTATVTGLDADETYYLEEVTAPDGYNKLTSRQEVTPRAVSQTTTTYTPVAAGAVYDQNETYYAENNDEYSVVEIEDATAFAIYEGTLYTATTTTTPVTHGFDTITVINNAGAELPSTGGIGTTIFYIIGAILVIGGGIVLVTRRRMG